jgi:hypothetical protein
MLLRRTRRITLSGRAFARPFANPPYGLVNISHAAPL